MARPACDERFAFLHLHKDFHQALIFLTGGLRSCDVCIKPGIRISALLLTAWVMPAEADAPDVSRQAQHRHLLFSGAELWRGGHALYGGLLWSPGGLDAPGFTFKLLMGGGLYGYEANGAPVYGRHRYVAALPGWRLKADRFEAFVYAGPETQTHRLYPDDPANRMRGDHTGLRFGADVWFEPTERLMATATVSASTIGMGYSARLAFGWKFQPLGWIGPEIQSSGDAVYRQIRFGLHLTGVTTGALEWSTAAGYLKEDGRPGEPYIRLGVLMRR